MFPHSYHPLRHTTPLQWRYLSSICIYISCHIITALRHFSGVTVLIFSNKYQYAVTYLT